jgi:transcription elongation factor GreA
MQKEPMLEQNFQKIKDELNYLKNELRPKIIKAIDEARQLGDLKENAEYHAAREDQRNCDKKIAELEDIISRVVVIDPSSLPHKKVAFGSTVKLYDIEEGKEICYKIVDFVDSDPNCGKISYNSPLSKALLGKEEGDEFIAKLPGGEKEFEILEIYYEN